MGTGLGKRKRTGGLPIETKSLVAEGYGFTSRSIGLERRVQEDSEKSAMRAREKG